MVKDEPAAVIQPFTETAHYLDYSNLGLKENFFKIFFLISQSSKYLAGRTFLNRKNMLKLHYNLITKVSKCDQVVTY